MLDSNRVQDVAGDGHITTDAKGVHWVPPVAGGTLRYNAKLSHRRKAGDDHSYDAWVGERFALFRGDRAFPIRSWRRARGSTLKGELSVARPKDWSLVTPYLPDGLGRMMIRNPGKRLPRPVGWIIAGDIGTRRDVFEGIEFTVSAPRGIRMERIAMLGILRWTLPQLVPALQGSRPPRYINIVAAGDPMWLGALSAPNSIYVNSARPLISENGTSTIVHEMMHVLLRDLKTPRDQDWIVEGLAEYLSLRALKDSGTISAQRYDSAIAGFRRWGASVKSLRTESASGPITARAVTIFHDLDIELRAASGDKTPLIAVVRDLLLSGKPANLATFRASARAVIGKPARTLYIRALPD
ncbi:MAG: hypothetical protein R3F24_10125 [Gammaproteobacteria bacterium]